MAVASIVMLAALAIGIRVHPHPQQSTTRQIGGSTSAIRGCSPPALTLNGSAVVARRNATPDYSTLSEIKFTARIPSPFADADADANSRHRLCKIKCVAGEWVGPLCRLEQNTSEEDGGRFHPILRSCRLHLNGTNLALFHDGALHKQWNGRIPDRSRVTILCDGAPGLYKMNGSPHLRCLDGDWNREMPSCLSTTSLSAYSENLPPTIRIKLAFGDSAIDYRNNLVVIYPGSIVHLECLSRRQYGDVRWIWTTTATDTSTATATAVTTTTSSQSQSQPQPQSPKSQLHQYQRNRLTGWSIAADEREWIYRLSLYYVKTEQDSGNYTCITAKHQNNTVTLKVEAVQCEKRNDNENANANANENERKRNVMSVSKTRGNHNHVGQTIEYACPVGFTLVGSNQSSCLADGKWSSTVPYCEPILCVPVPIADVHLIASGSNTTYGATIRFACARGYALKGANEMRCEIDARWSSSVPKCVDILCEPPSIPSNGYLLEKSNGPHYRAGTIVQFACEKPYRLVGQQSIVCEDSGKWSGESPTCRIVCEYPGEPANGHLVPSKFWYEAGDDLKVVCDTGYVTLESESIFVSCTKNGTWSTEIPRCVNSTRI